MMPVSKPEPVAVCSSSWALTKVTDWPASTVSSPGTKPPASSETIRTSIEPAGTSPVMATAASSASGSSPPRPRPRPRPESPPAGPAVVPIVVVAGPDRPEGGGRRDQEGRTGRPGGDAEEAAAGA
jgi:hypothetical protein